MMRDSRGRKRSFAIFVAAVAALAGVGCGRTEIEDGDFGTVSNEAPDGDDLGLDDSGSNVVPGATTPGRPSPVGPGTGPAPSGGCPPGLQACNGGCVDVQSNDRNCGKCGNECVPVNGTSLVCSLGICVSECAESLYGQGPTYTVCNGGCVDLQTNNANCGSCGFQCAPGSNCIEGSCVLLCSDGLSACGNQCVNLRTDNDHCGLCGQICSADLLCEDGGCVCPSGDTACGGVCTSVQSDPLNCGGCGHVCGDGQSCVGGLCRFGS